MNADRDAKVVDFLWLLLPLAILAAFRKGADPAGLVVGFALYFVGPTGASTCPHCNEAGASSCPERPARARTRAPDLDCSPRAPTDVCPGRRPAG